MYQRMVNDMDIDAGTILAGRPVEEVGREIFDQVLAVASGQATKSEKLNLGDEEFVPWNVGPTLQADASRRANLSIGFSCTLQSAKCPAMDP